MMRDEKLDRRLVILRATGTRDALGEIVESWGELMTVWAEKRERSSAERPEMGAEEVRGATITTIFTIRWSLAAAGIGPKDRARLGGLTYDITGVREIGRRQGIEIHGTARADGGGV